MLINFFLTLRKYKLPVTLRELMDLLEALKGKLVYANIDEFYLLSRTCLVKDEKNYDKFDRAFAVYFKGLEDLHGLSSRSFRRVAAPRVREVADAGRAREDQVARRLEKLIEAFQQAKAEEEKKKARRARKARKPGRRRPEQARRKGPAASARTRTRRRRRFGPAPVQESRRLGRTRHRNIKMALRRLRKFARSGKDEELDMDNTIRSTAHNGGCSTSACGRAKNTVKVLLFLDIGGSMDAHVKVCEELFSATRTEFKHMESFYFHNFIYESVWKDNRRRMNERMSTLDILNKFPHDYKVVFVATPPWRLTRSPMRRQRRTLE